LVDNADRRLPFQDASLDLALSVKGPKHAPELARVLRPGGHLLAVVPGPSDLVELRTATAGGGLPRDPAAGACARFAGPFELVGRRDVVERVALGPEALQDLLRAVYRGQRRSEAARAAGLAYGTVTSDSALLLFRRRYP
jgi:23S rRNA (guanine745-N1)-methyltransferase